MAKVDVDTFLPSKPQRTSRYSIYSVAALSAASQDTTDSAIAEIKDITTGLQRMENRALSQQRVYLSEAKMENMSKLALGAKLERALDRRMTSQDAVMRPRRETTSAVPSEATLVATAESKKHVSDLSDSQTLTATDNGIEDGDVKKTEA